MPSEVFGSKPNAPSGLIVMWDEPLSEIPSGWVICDGNNSTPNLLDRFVKEVPDTATDPGSTSGTKTNSLSNSQLPNHSHGSSLNNAGDHNHLVGYEYYSDYYKDGSGAPVRFTGSDPTTIYSDNTGDHSHSSSGTNSTGGGNSYDNQPAFYEVAYIMKL